MLKRFLGIGLVFVLLFSDVAWASTTQFTFGSTTIFDTAASNDAHVARLDAGRVIVVTQNGASIGTVSGNAISFGSAFSFAADALYTGVAVLDSTHAVIIYIDQNQDTKAVVATVSGTTIAYGTSVTLTTSSYANMKTIGITALDSTHIVMAYPEEGEDTFLAYLVAATVSGTTITLGTPVEYSNDASWMSLATLDSTHFVFSHQNGGQQIQAGSVSGTTITLGSSQSPSASCVDSSVTAIDSTHALMVYCDAHAINRPKIVLATITGTSVSLGSPQGIHDVLAEYFSIIKLDSTHAAVAYQDVDNSHFGTVSLVTINGDTLTVDTESVAVAGDVSFVSIALSDTNTIVFVAPNNSDGLKGYAVVGTIELPSSSSSGNGGDGGPSTALLQLRKQNGLDRWGYPLSSSSSSSASVASVSSSSSSPSSSVPSETPTHSAASSSSPSVSSSATVATEIPLKTRTCTRVMKWFKAHTSVLARLNARLMKHFGFVCEG